MAGPAKSKQKVLPQHPARLRRVDSLLSPCGPAFGCYCASLRFLVPSLLQGPDRMRPTDEGPSLAHRGSRGIHAAQPLDSLRSPSGPACGCYFAALRFTTIPLGLLTGRLASPARLAYQNPKVPKHCGKAAMLGLCFFLLICLRGQFRRLGFRIPSGGRAEVLWRGAFGMDAKRGVMGQGWPFTTTLGTAPERGELSAAKPGCRARFLFRASKEKVTRRKGEKGHGLRR